ncbi:MAG: tetratricopeptide repeat protein [Saprospiraceae bacterium]
MRVFLLVLFCLLFPKSLVLGQASLDSLEQILKTATDSNRVVILSELANSYTFINTEKSIQYAQEGIELGEKIQFETGRIDCLYQKAKSFYELGKYQLVDSLLVEVISFYQKKQIKKEASNSIRLLGNSQERQGNYDEALKYQEEALAIAQSINYTKGISNALNNIAIIYMRKADYDKSITTYLQAIELIDQETPNQLMANTYRNIGIVYKRKGDYEIALEYYFKALKINEYFKVPKSLARNWNSIGTIFGLLDNAEKSKDAYKKALTFLEHDPPSKLYAIILNNLGALYSHGINRDTALFYYQQSFQVSQELEGYVGQGILLYNIGSIYFGKKDYKTALKYYDDALHAEPHAPDKQNITRIWIKMGMLYFELSDYSKSIFYLEKGLEEASRLGLRKSKSDALEHLVIAYEQINQPQKALSYQQEYILVKDSLFNEKKATQIQELILSQEEIQNQQKIKILEQDKIVEQFKKERLWIIIIALSLIGILLFLFQRNRIRYAQKQQHLLTIQKNWLELQSLRNQFKPHFVFNALSSIQNFLIIKDTEKAQIYLSQFSQLMREMLENTESDNILLEDEINFLKRYLSIEQLRTDHHFDFEIIKNQDVDESDILIPNLILQTIVENSVWHGIMPRKEKGNIYLRFKKEGKWLLMEVEDDGVGRDYRKKEDHNSKGLNLLQQRIEAINQKEDQSIQWNIEDLKNQKGNALGTKVSIKYLVEAD